MSKLITKSLRENLNLFIQRTDINTEKNDPELATSEQVIKQNKKIIKKNDGLFETQKMENKIIISEDNRQFLRD